MIQLRTYQSSAVAEIREALVKYRRVMFQAPCGAGKTVIFSYIANSSQKYDRKVLILSNRSEILMQNGGSMEAMGLKVQYINPRNKNVPTENIVCAMAQTMQRRIEKPEWQEYVRSVELLVIDEAHCCDGDYIHDYLNPNAWVLGVSATPQRRSHQRQLGDMYKALVQSITVKDLIAQGYLSKSHHYSIISPALDGVNIDSGTGDYNRQQLARVFEDRKIYVGIVQEYLRLTPHKKAICFCVSSTQAIEMVKEFEMNGVSAKYILSGKFDEDHEYSGKRDDVFEEFRNNEFEVLVNVGVCTAGFDQRDIEVVILNFATVSITRYLQAVGRGSRVTDTKHEFTVLDAGGNYQKFGVYEEDRIWTLWHDEHKSGGVMAVKECDATKVDCNGKMGCGALVPVTCKVCPCCGWTFPTEEYQYRLYLEEVQENAKDSDSMDAFCAAKRKEGWKLSRILIQVCLRNAGNEKKAFIRAYTLLNPGKTEEDAQKYWWVWSKNVWSNVRMKRNIQTTPKLF